jgi:uncharacterized protein (TIGR03435 family)
LTAFLVSALLVAAWSDPVSFEVASVKRAAPLPPAPPGAARLTNAPRRSEDPGSIRFLNVTLKGLLVEAYEVQPDQISGPAWLDDDRYDLIAALPPGAKKADVPAMWRSLLAGRFGVVARTEQRQRRGYLLKVEEGGPRFAAAAKDGKAGFTWNSDSMKMRGTTMPGLAKLLSLWLGRPVEDQTGLDGNFDLTLAVAMSEITSGDAGALFGAIRPLGLRLEPVSRLAPFVVVEKANRVPTEN